MKPTLRLLAVLVVSIAAVAGMAQEPQLPTGNWRSTASATYTNPALTGAELYLSIDVAKDGSFQGVWGQYLCNAYPGAYGISIYSCNRTGSNVFPVDSALVAKASSTWSNWGAALSVDRAQRRRAGPRSASRLAGQRRHSLPCAPDA